MSQPNDTSVATDAYDKWVCSDSNMMEATRIAFCLTNNLSFLLLCAVLVLWMLRPATRNLSNFISTNMCLTAVMAAWLVASAFFATATRIENHCGADDAEVHVGSHEAVTRDEKSLSSVPKLNAASIVMYTFEMWWSGGMALCIWISSDAQTAAFFRGVRPQKYNASIVAYYGIPIIALASLILSVRDHYSPSGELALDAVLDFVFASKMSISQLATLTQSEPSTVFMKARYVHWIISYGVPLLICALVYVHMLRTWKTRPVGTVCTVLRAFAINIFTLNCIVTYISTVTDTYHDPKVFSGIHMFLLLLHPIQAMAVCLVHMLKAENRSAWLPCARESVRICTNPTECTRMTADILHRDFQLS